MLKIIFIAHIVLASVLCAAEPLPAEVVNVGVEEKVNVQVDPNLRFTNANGESVTLGSLLHKDKPLVLNFIYFNCPMLCSLVLDSVVQVLPEVDKRLGDDYEALVVSFEPRDTPERAKAYQDRYVSQLKKSDAEGPWQFWVGKQEAIDAITSQTGFQFKYNEKTKEYAHAAVTIVLTPEGKVSRYLYGVNYSPFDLKLALIEAKKGLGAFSIDRALMFCYQYDPEKRGYILQAWKMMRGAGILTLLMLLSFLVYQRYSERFRK